MPRIAYVNGRYLPQGEARVSIEDRGFQFADGVYEVIAVKAGGFVDLPLHLARLSHSLDEIRVPAPMTQGALTRVMAEMLRLNEVHEGYLYLQITRGAAPRDFAFPRDVTPSLVMTARRARLGNLARAAEGVAVITIPDIRWQRCDIKSVGLLASVLGKQQAREAGAFEAWQVDEAGFITEGTSSNAWIITAAGEAVTRRADHMILNGVTRLGLIGVLAENGLSFRERSFTRAEAYEASEAFLTSTTNFVMPVVRIDGRVVGSGLVGPVARVLIALYAAHAGGGR
ncbi:MAG TPA: D-amino-acid transaminase [Stellaceae bacterium]|nr:D-amino-acid transaminase [Stellaceae bacterium]